MTVADLIAALSKLPPDAPVLTYGHDSEALSPVDTPAVQELARMTADIREGLNSVRGGTYWNPEYLTDVLRLPAAAFEVVRVVVVTA